MRAESPSNGELSAPNGKAVGLDLKILFLAVEAAPYAKVGGLADVAGSLPDALRKLGHDVRLMMPRYAMIDAPTKEVANFRVDVNAWWHKRAALEQIVDPDSTTYLLGTDEWFDEVDRSEKIYAPGVDAYLFFSRGALRACEALDWIPDVVHCHDWHTGLTPVMMRTQHHDKFSHTGALFTIHNLAYQGEFGPDILDKVGLSQSLFNLHELEAYSNLNFLKSGAAFSDYTNTVSRTYSQEIQTSEFGCRLEGFLQNLHSEGRLSGILNGLDVDAWNPATDLSIASNYEADHPEAKSKCRDALFQELRWEPIEGAPLAGVVSRLSSQKGMDLMLAAASEMFAQPIQLVVQGLGDPWLADEFRKLETKYPKHFRFAQKFDIDLAQRVYAGSDLFLMPSAFEPCGLGQLIAMRYGTAPVVRRTGGLADTVDDDRTGFVFEERSSSGLLDAVSRACVAYRDAQRWKQIVGEAMHHDASWSRSAKEYEQLYAKCAMGRRSEAAIAS